ncbi:hypothetical protein ACQW02_17010 [Humitalea sp. 24SJ18S-53]|uniref:hypothetical protein n=1 Tax=Humitalea sp. 24SJ18S-53 TaxID=3422307 RepID=UPI003D66F7D5
MALWITRRGLAAVGGTVALPASVLPLAAMAQRADPNPDASVEIEEVRVGIGIVAGSIGGGRLRWRGEEYPFRVRGLGVGALGLTSLQARGEVFNLSRLEDFSGAYTEEAQDPPAADTPPPPPGGPLVRFLRNGNGVRLRLRASRDGAMLEIAPGGLNIELR